MDFGGVSRGKGLFEKPGEAKVSKASEVQPIFHSNSTPSYVRSTEGKLNEDANYSLFKNNSDSSHSPKVTAPVQTPINSTKWYCSQCGYANLSNYSYCMQCGLQKAEK